MSPPKLLCPVVLLLALVFQNEAARTCGQVINSVKNEETQTSDWGPETSGLQLRVTLPKRLEQGKSIEAAAEFRSDATRLAPGVHALNPCWDMCSHFHLHLTNLDGGFLSVLDASTRVFGPPPAEDDGRWATPFVPEQNIRSAAYFTTLVEATPIASGRYRAQLVYDQPLSPNPGWRTGWEEWIARGFWSGKVASQPVEIEIIPESSRTETIFVPKRLHFVKFDSGSTRYRGPYRADESVFANLVYSMEDAEPVVVPRRNGHWIMHSTTSTKDGRMGSHGITGGPPTPDGRNGLDAINALNFQGDNLDYDFTVSIFESCEPNLRASGPGCAGYKLLWERTFHIHYTAEELSNLPVNYEMTP